MNNETPLKLYDGTVVDPFIVRLLIKRGVDSSDLIRAFLQPKLSDLPDPFFMLDMKKASDIIVNTIFNNDNIVIWGDYDVDGTTATALLLRFFKLCGCTRIHYFIPNRLQEGYGLNVTGLHKISSAIPEERKLLITVDNGISSFEEIALAKDLGFSTIVTDHHIAPEKRVPADAVLNPKQRDCNFPDKDLAGVGVAFYLITAVRNRLIKSNFYTENKKPPNLKALLDLVAIGTIADMVPLQGINRILVRAGLESIDSGENHGITALCDISNVDKHHVRSEDIAFQLGPKINAAGRMGRAEKAVELFLCSTRKEAEEIATYLVQANNSRKEKNMSDLKVALEMVAITGQKNKSSLLIAGDFHIGVAGIVASNLTEKYGKPSIVLCRNDEGLLKGSARSIPGVNIFKTLEECRDCLLTFGGHKMAGGLCLDAHKLDEFMLKFEKTVYKQSKGVVHQTSIKAECTKSIPELFKQEILDQLYLLEPFGEGNPQPIIRDQSADIIKISAVGRDKTHLRLTFANGDTEINGVGFWLGEKLAEIVANSKNEILYTPTINFFRGNRKWEARVLQINKCTE